MSKPTARSTVLNGDVNSNVNSRPHSILSSLKDGVSQVTGLVEASFAPLPTSPDGLSPKEVIAPSDPKAALGVFSTLFEQTKDHTLAEGVKVAFDAATQVTQPLDDRKLLLEEVVTLLGRLPDGSKIGTDLSNTLIHFLWNDLVRQYSSALGSIPSDLFLLSSLIHPRPTLALESSDLLMEAETTSKIPLSELQELRAQSFFHVAYARSVAPVHPLPRNLPDPGVVFDALLSRDKFEPHPSGISVILNQNHTDSPWALFPNNVIKVVGQGDVPRGVGNACSVEFNILYRWHAAVSAEDEKWLEGIIDSNLPGGPKPYQDISPQDLGAIFQNLQDKAGPDLQKWTFGGISRTGKEGKGYFRDSDLANILANATDAVAGAFKGRGSPACMRIIDVLGMAVARNTWNTCSLNEFRDFLNLKRFEKFEEWNPDPKVFLILWLFLSVLRDLICLALNKIWKTAEKLYTHIDNMELFPGLSAEARKPSMDGSGLAPGYTISRAILSDAGKLSNRLNHSKICSQDCFSRVGARRSLLYNGLQRCTNSSDVCGWRLISLVYIIAASLTNWGFEDVSPDYKAGAFGGVVGKLLMRALPTSYKFNSIYALFPFSTPKTTKEILIKLGIAYKYDFSRPGEAAAIVPATTYQAVNNILSENNLLPNTVTKFLFFKYYAADHKMFGVIYGPSIKQIVGNNYGFFIDSDNVKEHARDRDVMDKALFPTGWEVPLKKFFAETTRNLTKSKSWSYDGGKTMNLDVVRDVTTIAVVDWVANQFGFPLKTKDNPRGLMTPQELHGMLATFFAYVFQNFDPQPGFALRDEAISHSKLLGTIIRVRMAQVAGTPALIDNVARAIQDKLLGPDANALVMSKEAHDFYRRLLNSHRPHDQLNASAQSIMVASTANQGEVAAHVINFYLRDDMKDHCQHMVHAANSTSPDSDDDLWRHILEAMRLDPQVTGIPRVANFNGSFRDGNRDVPFKAGDMIFASIYNSSRDPSKIPHPNEVDVSRDPSIYNVFGAGIHNCLGAKLVRISMVAMVREVFKLKNVRRAVGPAGQLYRFKQDFAGTPTPTYITAQATLTPFPVSLSVVYDA
ncbi:hypothetical protein P7C70_g7182, partial [Phenoliferia sp. Uapishka_3]